MSPLSQCRVHRTLEESKQTRVLAVMIPRWLPMPSDGRQLAWAGGKRSVLQAESVQAPDILLACRHSDPAPLRRFKRVPRIDCVLWASMHVEQLRRIWTV